MILRILKDANVILNYDVIEYLGYVIDEKGLHPTEEKLQTIKQAPRPTNVTELRAFLWNYKILLEIFAKFIISNSSFA